MTYDGADLGVRRGALGDATWRRWSPPHAEVEYVAAFCGFAPGFAYLAGLPEERAVPRLDSPRSQVPPGRSALAGTWCGVYPTASPGAGS